LANGRPVTSPTTVIDNLTKGFSTDVTESNATTAYNDYPATTQAYAGVVYSKTGGIGGNSGLFLQTNGQTNLAVNGGGNAVQTFAPLQVTNAENNFLQITPEAISFNGLASNALTIADGGQFGIGQTVEVLPGVLAVYNSASNTETNLTPTSLLIGTYANTTSNISQDFAGQSLTGPGYNVQRPVFGGITWTTTGAGVPDAGITKVNPALSSKAVTAAGAFPGANAQAAYLGNYLVAAPQPVGTYNGLILPTLSAAQPGETVTLSYAYAGGQSGKIVVNGILVQSIPSSAVWVNASTSFLSTGNDEVEIQTQVIPYTGNSSQFNITNIVFTFTVASVSVPQVSVASTGRNSANYGILNLLSLSNNGSTLGSYAQIGDVYNGITLITPGGCSLLMSSNIVLSSTTNVTFNSGTINATGTMNMGGNINMGGNDITAAALISASNITVSNTLTAPTISGVTSLTSSNITATTTISTPGLNGVSGGTLNIGYAGGLVSLSNAALITGQSTTTDGLLISNCGRINSSPACPPATAFYTANFNGTKGVSMTILPKQSLGVRNNVVFGGGYTSDSFISNLGFTLPPNTTLAYSNISSGTTQTYSNPNANPTFVSDSGFSPSSSSQTYSLTPNLLPPP